MGKSNKVDLVFGNLPELTGNLLGITDLEETDVMLPNPEGREELTPAVVQMLYWAERSGSAVLYTENGFNSTVKNAKLLTLRALITVRNNPDSNPQFRQEELADSVLIAARGIIAHTPYAKAFISTKHKPSSAPSLQEHISSHADNYQELMPFMFRRQKKAVKRNLSFSV